MKKCSNCKKIKPAKDFYKYPNGKTGLASRCKVCHLQACYNYRKTEKGKEVMRQGSRKYRNSERGKQSYRTWRLNNDFGITLDDYDEMAKNQNGLCAICGLFEVSKQGKKTQVLSIDHNHNTKQIRGLLCRKCNQALGLLNVDNFGILNLQMAIKYLGDSKNGRHRF